MNWYPWPSDWYAELIDAPVGVGTMPAAAVITQPTLSDWVVEFANIRYRPEKGKEPNGFHRWTQGLILGLRWRLEPER